MLDESQVGINPLTGRPKIVLPVVEEMRRYLIASEGEDIAIREERVRALVKVAEYDPVLQRSVLRLEPIPTFTKELKKGKGIVFAYTTDKKSLSSKSLPQTSEKLLSGAIRAGQRAQIQSSPVLLEYGNAEDSASFTSKPLTTFQRFSLLVQAKRVLPGKSLKGLNKEGDHRKQSEQQRGL